MTTLGEHPRQSRHLREIRKFGPAALRHLAGSGPAHLRHLVLQRTRPPGLYGGAHPAAHPRARRQREPAHPARREPRRQRQLFVRARARPPRGPGRAPRHTAGAGAAALSHRHGDGRRHWPIDGADGPHWLGFGGTVLVSNGGERQFVWQVDFCL